MTAELTQFDYLLNAFEEAGKAIYPAKHGYADKRRALFAHVRELERRADLPSQPPEAVGDERADAKILLGNGQTILDHVEQQKMLPAPKD